MSPLSRCFPRFRHRGSGSASALAPQGSRRAIANHPGGDDLVLRGPRVPDRCSSGRVCLTSPDNTDCLRRPVLLAQKNTKKLTSGLTQRDRAENSLSLKPQLGEGCFLLM